MCISIITDAYVYKHKMDAGMGPTLNQLTTGGNRNQSTTGGNRTEEIILSDISAEIQRALKEITKVHVSNNVMCS